MSQMTDIMVDVETTGLNPHHAAIIQLSGIKFNLAEQTVGTYFDRAPDWLPFRSWHNGTRDFWSKHPDVYESILLRTEPPEAVYRDFVNWVDSDAPEGGYRFWSKPLTFDWPIVASHLEQLSLPMPFHFRIARDMNSYIAGMKGDAAHPNADVDVVFNGQPHNALHDCGYQIDVLFHSAKRFISTEIM